MPELGPHAAFILAAYGVTFLAVAALTIFIVQDDRNQRRTLDELERQGIRRRSPKPESSQGAERPAPKLETNRTRTLRSPKA